MSESPLATLAQVCAKLTPEFRGGQPCPKRKKVKIPQHSPLQRAKGNGGKYDAGAGPGVAQTNWARNRGLGLRGFPPAMGPETKGGFEGISRLSASCRGPAPLIMRRRGDPGLAHPWP